MNASGTRPTPMPPPQAMDIDQPPVASSSGSGASNAWKTTDKWSDHIEEFLKAAGLVQALRGLREDLLILSPECEAKYVPIALGNLRIRLLDSVLKPVDRSFVLQTDPEEERLKQAQALNSESCTSRGHLTKDISKFLSQHRARVNRSNRMEFLQSFQSKREKLGQDTVLSKEDEDRLLITCARTDAKPQNRDVQMKYEVYQNEDGPLRKTIKKEEFVQGSSKIPAATPTKGVGSGAPLSYEPSLLRHPGLTERFNNVEDHLAIRYVPAPPFSLMERIRMIEEHLIKLEREYPAWAALHFKQPKRGWPPPPGETALIVPTHLTSSARPDVPPSTSTLLKEQDKTAALSAEPPIPKGKYARANSSLHKALMDKLHVKHVMEGMQTG